MSDRLPAFSKMNCQTCYRMFSSVHRKSNVLSTWCRTSAFQLITQYLNQHFPYWWIGCGGGQHWPPQ